MNDFDKDLEKINNEDMSKITKKDFLAFMIAQFEILMPIVLIFAAGMSLILFLISRLWIK